MKKWLIRFGVGIGVLLVLLMIARATNALQWWRSPTFANAPTLPYSSLFFTSNLFDPSQYDFICYNTESPEFGKHVTVHRLCGLPGDKVEIKSGLLYVNGASPDSAFHLLKPYAMHAGDYNEELNEGGIEPVAINGDSLQVMLNPNVVAEKGLKATPYFPDVTDFSEPIFKRWRKPWTQNDFGPVTVPVDSYFVLGDNRLGANDSRFSGFVKKEDVVGTVLGK